MKNGLDFISFKSWVRLGQSILTIHYLGVKNEDKVTNSTTRVRLGQSMLDNNSFKGFVFSSQI